MQPDPPEHRSRPLAFVNARLLDYVRQAISVAPAVAGDLDYIRIDFLVTDDCLYAGEIAVYSAAGYATWTNPAIVREIERCWRLDQSAFLRRRHSGAALMMTSAFSWAELGLSLALFSLAYWFAADGLGYEFKGLFDDEASRLLSLMSAVIYALVVLFLEPFYVAAGFGMYLNRRAELEAWDIEQEFRRAFAS